MVKIPMWVAVIIIIIAVIFFWGWFSADIVLKIPRLKIETTPKDYGLNYENHIVTSSDGLKLSAWFVPYQGSATTVILLHGWGANKGNILPNTYFLHHRGHYNLLYADYRNHGESEGKRTSLGYHEKKDVKAMVEFLKKSKPESSKHIGILGVSLGAVIGILGSAEIPEIEALVAESPFGRPSDVIVRYGKLFYNMPRFPLIDITVLFVQLKLGVRFKEFQAVDYIGRIAPRPVYLIQSADDLRMPRSEGESLIAAAKEPKKLWTVPGADHGEAYAKAPVEYEKKVLKFFEQYISP